MTIVFIGGSRRIIGLPATALARIDKMIENRLDVIVGDAAGADRAAQQHLQARGYDRVEVFCSGTLARHNVGGWPVRAIPAGTRKRDFGFYSIKDRAMADEADFGFMLWDEASVGTLMNVWRLTQRSKKVVVHLVPRDEFVEVTSESDWEGLLQRCGGDLRARVLRESMAEQNARVEQAGLF